MLVKLACRRPVGEMMWFRPALLALLLAAMPAAAAEQTVTPCASCAAWNVPQAPFRVAGNTYYVGTHELSAILIASKQGLVLIDGDLAESAPQIAGNIRALGFRPEDIKLILNSHAHYDHAAGIAPLQRLSGSKVAASPWSAQVLRRGTPTRDDPQYGLGHPPYAGVSHVELLSDGQTLQVGPLALTAHFTPGHTPGGTSWSWTSCERQRCLHIVYADSLTAVSADQYRFTDHPDLLAGFEKSFAALEAMPCDILLTPHPGFSDTLKKLEAREKDGKADAFIDPGACKMLAASSRQGLAKRISQEKAGN
jgi:metallo-beta-lactamase class B